MPRLILLLPLFVLLPLAGRAADAPAPKAAEETPAPEAAAPELSPEEKALRPLVARQQDLLAAAVKAGDDLDEETFRRDMQELSNSYEDYLKKYPNYGTAYAAYGVLLGKLSMRRQSAMLLLKADELFVKDDGKAGARTPAFIRTWALVKNQLGNFVAEEGRPLEAVNYYLSAIDLTPNEPLYHYQLGKLLTDARDDFLKSGQWTRAALDKAMHDAFKRAAELAPDRLELTYRYAESFYDLEKPDWDTAIKTWADLEEKAKNDLERQTMRLHAANILIKQRKFEHALAMLASVTEEPLQKQRQKLTEDLKTALAKPDSAETDAAAPVSTPAPAPTAAPAPAAGSVPAPVFVPAAPPAEPAPFLKLPAR
jgi:tetratricopeptide (TPR) repeat protein